MFKWAVLLFLLSTQWTSCIANECMESVTTVSGQDVHPCSGDLIFEDNFDTLNLNTWEHVLPNPSDFDYFHDYVNDRKNSFVRDGVLYLRPTLNDVSAADVMEGKRPTNSARISTRTSFAFKYGKMEVRAQVPGGDWLQPAIWLVPPRGYYGGWPMSGEIDIMESRGNRKLTTPDGEEVGSEQIGTTLHYGPNRAHDGWKHNHKRLNTKPGRGFDVDFHNYGMVWTPTHFNFTLDGRVFMTIDQEQGFWRQGRFDKIRPPLENIWANGTLMAPFDIEFKIILNVAVGGFTWFGDQDHNGAGRKPWRNSDRKHGMQRFWEGRGQWLPTWANDASAMKVDYVRVWAL